MYYDDQDDFLHEEVAGICIETVNITRATSKETEVFREKINSDLKNGNKKFIIDLSRCDFIDSSFMGALVLCTKKSLNEKAIFVLVIREGGYLSSLFRTTRLERVLTIFETRQAALDYFLYNDLFL
jgi:anti-anti-sigma factor